MDLNEAREKVFERMAQRASRSEAITRVAFDMTQTQKEFGELKAALEQMEFDVDKDLDEVIKRLERAQ